jgi:hypothetical protein
LPTLTVFILSINAKHSKFDYRSSEFLEVPLSSADSRTNHNS